MPIPDYQTLMLPVLSLAAQGETTVPLISDKIADLFGLSAEERDEMLPSGKQRLLHNRVHWAKFYMSKAGLISSPKRGTFTASDAGKQLLATNPSGINVETLKGYPAFMDFYSAGKLPSDSAVVSKIDSAAQPATPEEQIDSAHELLTSALRADLLARILEQSPSFFEGVTVKLLVAIGYGGSLENAAKRLGKSGDGGVDGVIDEDRLGLDRIYVQAKRYALGSVIGRPELQAFVGSLVGLGASNTNRIDM